MQLTRRLYLAGATLEAGLTLSNLGGAGLIDPTYLGAPFLDNSATVQECVVAAAG
jgi:hypothetical protein